jgi:hypothetical protein
MQIHGFIYEAIASHGLRCDAIVFFFRRREGGEAFGVKLTIEDARRLLHDLPEQIRIASGEDA